MAKTATKKDQTVAEKLDSLHSLQNIDSEIDRIKTLRGELPLEVQDLEDEVEGLDNRVVKMQDELKTLETEVSDRKNSSKDANASIAKYKEQQNNVRNNREYDSISKEIEYQELEIQLNEKKNKELKFRISSKKEILEATEEKRKLRGEDLESKNSELDAIIAETQAQEDKLAKKSKAALKKTDERLGKAYTRLRSSAKNGLAVVEVERNACGGCYNQIPIQRQIDIRAKKKIIVCEHCGRILVPGEVED